MITAAHLIQYSRDADADRAFLRDVLGWHHVAAGGPGDDWLIFRLPPAELGVHPTDGEPVTQLFLMCDDIAATVADLREHGVGITTEPQQQAWGTVTGIRLPSGAEVGLYEPRHATAYDA